MPNYYAHLVFGREVLSLLPKSLQGMLWEEAPAFQVGLLGPDPLFFYRPWARSLPLAVGVETHARQVRPAAERLLALIREGRPYAGSYAAGFLCHFALDSRCHAYVARREREGGPSHRRMESELDAALMRREGIDPLRRAPFPQFRLPKDFYETAAAVYPGVTPRQFAGGLDAFRRLCRAQALLAGTLWRHVTERFPLTRGSVLGPRPDPACRETTARLLALLEEEKFPAAQALTGFFRAAREGEALGEWYDRTFDGG